MSQRCSGCSGLARPRAPALSCTSGPCQKDAHGGKGSRDSLRPKVACRHRILPRKASADEIENDVGSDGGGFGSDGRVQKKAGVARYL